ncbi:hypothetical protein CEY16_13275 [Halalkalibacillus sediminis]|uniref:DUF1206 domain-containing protein n=1 Tax=Halalkalibacillus sediminis TaxID=2018042 RepID=A0A2I0QR11_9BACI|nr:DUF1206 domain-containing protein [Halalkalibacillus sediminis]PKR76785.1 hypothetical protein CEY16_13275 [Halalkalibacillus sediminis]
MSTSSRSYSSRKTKEEIKPWVRRLARVGYMAKGLVFVLVGILTFMAAIGIGGNTEGTQGMFKSLAGMPFGEVLLWIIGIGLFLYIMWLLIKVVKDPQNKGKGMKGIFGRGASLVIAIIYSGLALSAIQVASSAGGRSGGGNSEKTMSAELLSQPYGQWIIGIIGGIIIFYGLNEAYKGITTKFMKRFHTQDMSTQEKKVARNSGRLGLTARGIVLAMVGYFFIQVAYTADSDQAKGLDGALNEIAQESYGQWLLGIAAIGLFLYGIYQIARGRYQHMGMGRY